MNEDRRRLFRNLAIASVVLFLLPFLRYTKVPRTPHTVERRWEFRIGLPFSPWFEYESKKTVTAMRTATNNRGETAAEAVSSMTPSRVEASHHWALHFTSYSLLVLIAAVVFLVLRHNVTVANESSHTPTAVR
jgi:hypothetical protein